MYFFIQFFLGGFSDHFLLVPSWLLIEHNFCGEDADCYRANLMLFIQSTMFLLLIVNNKVLQHILNCTFVN